ncbi:hypothetical protein PG993_010443 [Apiospora rasikravindrae]|uniref:Uncharacterized protein n=1 Tax=Apiospora rasikravindrae TaxID=990691 RepID=A0ABR1SPL3_9PEZI
MLEPATAPCGLTMSDAGFEPESWDDKLRVSATDPDQGGDNSIYVTGNPMGHPRRRLVMHVTSAFA